MKLTSSDSPPGCRARPECGGFDAAIYREHFFATHVGNRNYSSKMVMIDFLDPYQWVCSDSYPSIPNCS